VVDKILTRLNDSQNVRERMLGILFLGALDEAPHLVPFLQDPKHPQVRGTAAHVLRTWLGRSADRPAELTRIIQERTGYGKEKSALIVKLRGVFPEEALARPETRQELVGYLDHENLAVRELAYWHLALRFPDGARRIPYDPLAEPEQRQESI